MTPATNTDEPAAPTFGPVAFRTGCSVPNCERSHRCRGLCHHHYMQARNRIKSADPVWVNRRRTRHADYIRRKIEADPEWAERRRVAQRDSTARCRARRRAARAGES